MEFSMVSVLILTTIFLLSYVKNVETVNCYVCSWNPQDKDLEEDRCSKGNFDERKATFIDCKTGCEVVKILDSNGELLIFYRNCLMASPTKFDYQKSSKKLTIMTEEEMEACESDLCNTAVFTTGKSYILQLLLFFLPFFYIP